MRGFDKCWSHDPSHAQALKQNGARGGKAGGRGRARSGASELRDLRRRLADLADAVEAGEVSPSVAHAIAALGNVRIRAAEVERKIAETDELLRRIEALESHERDRSGRRRSW